MNSAFFSHVSHAEEQYGSYEQNGITAWRSLTADLCGEGPGGMLEDDLALPRLSAFLDDYPELINFQNNHAVSALGRPYGYWGYATLLCCAACRAHRSSDTSN